MTLRNGSESKLQISSLLNGSITKFEPKAKECTAKPGQRGTIRSTKIGQMGSSFFFFGGGGGCPVPGCSIHHLRKRKIVIFFDLQARATSEIAVADLRDLENR